MGTQTLLIGALGFALAFGSVSASPDEFEREEYYEGRGPMPFEVFDLNADGVVTAEEHATVRAQRMNARAAQGYPMRGAAYAPTFEEIDRDGSGAIDRDELSATQAMRGQPRWAQ